ncbi:MAG: hypothetical protein E7662_09880 [Ruminococcaceae bacterium]|nr:hypothetical protein [Oscillospiraceae bacterium]
MTFFLRTGIFAVLMLFVFSICASTPADVPAAASGMLSASVTPAETETAAESTVPVPTETTAPVPQETAADTYAETSEETAVETEAVTEAETDPVIPEPAETEAPPPPEPEIPPAYPVSSLVPMTEELPIIRIQDEPPAVTAEIRDGRVILPSMIGWNAEAVAALTLPEIQIEFAHDWYPLPEGVIYAASFTGEMTEDTFCVLEGTTLTLHVSRGMGPYISVLTEESKTVYLTFDDGPHTVNTASILDTLDDYGIKATFFMVGSYVKAYPETVREVYERGHKIGCHSYSHNYSSIYKNAENMMAEVEKWENAVTEAIGHIPPERLFRYPGGSTNCGKPAIHDALLKAGWRIFDWNALNNDCLLHTRPADVSELDFMKESFIETVAYSFRLRTAPHIILMHDSYAQTAELLPWVIEYLQSLGCSFATPDELPAGWHY